METTNELLDLVKERHGLTSDYALSQRLGLTRSVISAYRTKKWMLGEEPALKVASMLGLDPGYVLASIEAQRTHNEATRRAWEKTAERLKSYGVTAVLLLLAVTPADSWRFAYYCRCWNVVEKIQREKLQA